MCTAITFKGDDLIYGFNLDIDPAVWNYSLHKTKELFAVGITVSKTTYYVHGVNRGGCFGNVPYMNADSIPAPKGKRRERIDLMNDRYIRGKYTFDDMIQILRTKALCSIPEAAMHSLIGSGNGEFIIAEPGYGYQKIDGRYAVLTNFPVLIPIKDYSNPFYGKERYDKTAAALEKAGAGFSAEDALRALLEVRQQGQWATRVTFVYSKNQNAVYYCEEDPKTIRVHRFAET